VQHRVTGHHGPMVIGHEFSGTVVEIGDGVDPSWQGRRVASFGAVSCGTCPPCRAGRTNLCVSYHAVGLHRDGALAAYVATPTSNVATVDDHGLTPDAAALGQPMSIAVHARNRGRVRPDDKVVLLGVGGIGAFIVHAVSALGCPVVAIDAAPERLALAHRLGASATLTPEQVSPDAVADLLDGPPSVVMEATGRAAALSAAAGLTPPGGRLVAVGIHDAPREVDMRRLTLSELELIGSNAMVRTDFDEALKLLAERNEGWDDIASTVLTLDQVPADGLGAIAAGRAPSVKVLVDPTAALPRPAETRPQNRGVR